MKNYILLLVSLAALRYSYGKNDSNAIKMQDSLDVYCNGPGFRILKVMHENEILGRVCYCESLGNVISHKLQWKKCLQATQKVLSQIISTELASIEDEKEKTHDLRCESDQNYVNSEDWDPKNFTNPKDIKETPNKYMFIVHGLSGQLIRDLQKIESLKIEKLGTKKKKKIIDLLKTPNKISEKPLISTSLINDRKNSTFSPCGFILNVPKENFVASSSQDMGTINVFKTRFTISELDKECNNLRYKHGLHKTPSELLKVSNTSQYNEVVVRGSTEGNKVTINGIFIFRDEENRSLCPSEVEGGLRTIKNSLKLPVIYLAKTFYKYEDLNIKVGEERPMLPGFSRLISLQKNGVRHVLDEKKYEYFAFKDTKNVATKEKFNFFFDMLKKEFSDNLKFREDMKSIGLGTEEAIADLEAIIRKKYNFSRKNTL